MKIRIILLLFLVQFTSLYSQMETLQKFHDFVVSDINGDEFRFSALKGKKVLIVNTASKCGFTPQYKELQELYEQFGGEHFEIIGFPANNFLRQEPGTNSQIKEFCTTEYSVSFPMMSKISVKGADIHPLYRWLTQKDLNGVLNAEITWNFQKFLIDESGQLIKVFPPKVSPLDDEIVKWLR